MHLGPQARTRRPPQVEHVLAPARVSHDHLHAARRSLPAMLSGRAIEEFVILPHPMACTPACRDRWPHSLAGVDGFAASPHPTACRPPEWGQGRRSVADAIAKGVWEPGGHGQALSHMAGPVGACGPIWLARCGAGGEVRADGKAGTPLHGQARWDLGELAVLQRER